MEIIIIQRHQSLGLLISQSVVQDQNRVKKFKVGKQERYDYREPAEFEFRILI
jgi:hypothetical protein